MTHRLINGQGELVLYGPVGGSWWSDEGFTDADVLAALEEMDGDIVVRINSGGGAAFQGIAIHNALKRHDGRVTMMVDALAASAASVILMAGDERLMGAGAMLMVHDPSTITWGDAEEHRAQAGMLEKLAASAVSIYAEATGLAEGTVREVMRAETWLTAAEAITDGWATAEASDDAQMSATPFPFDLYAHAPRHLLALTPQKAAGAAPNAVMTAHPEAVMANQTKEDAPAAAPEGNDATQTARGATPTAETQTAPRQAATTTALDTAAVYDRAGAAGLTIRETQAILNAADTTEAALSAIIDRVAETRNVGGEIDNRVTVQADERERFRQGAERALSVKVGLEGERNEFISFTLGELARFSLQRGGADMSHLGDRMRMVGAAFLPTMGGMHGSSDFAAILENIANKSMLKGYEEAPETFDRWTGRGSASDFKIAKRVDAGFFGNLDVVPEGAEYSYGTMSDRGVPVMIATYGKMFAITRQAVINDDLSVLGRTPRKMGAAAKRTIGTLVYGVLINNPTFADGTALFHADHNNLGTAGAPSIASFEEAEKGMMEQRDPDQIAEALNITPAYVIGGGGTKYGIRKVLTSTSDPDAKHTGVPNTVQGMAEHVVEARIRDGSYFFAADPAAADTIEVTYLDGNDQPFMDQQQGWNVDGTEFKVRIDVGVNPLDFRGLYKNAGA